MKAVKKINNNVAYCIDAGGKDVIALGKGVGFGSFPRELALTEIERTFYNIDNRVAEAITNIDDDIFRISLEIIDYANSLIDEPLSPTIVFTMADHINFTIQRYRDGNKIRLPIAYDIQYLFENEYKVGLFALKIIKDKLKIYLPNDEASYIALHIVNAKTQNSSNDQDEEMINDIVKIIEKEFSISINRQNFSYSRFVSHMHYLLKRIRNKEPMEEKNSEMYEALAKQYSDLNHCVEEITVYLNCKNKVNLTRDEKMYLLLHINRLYDREQN